MCHKLNCFNQKLSDIWISSTKQNDQISGEVQWHWIFHENEHNNQTNIYIMIYKTTCGGGIKRQKICGREVKETEAKLNICLKKLNKCLRVHLLKDKITSLSMWLSNSVNNFISQNFSKNFRFVKYEKLNLSTTVCVLSSGS